MNYTTLGIMMHNRCNAACDICSVNCSPICEDELDTDLTKRFIESCIGTTIQYVAFTGGEPFLKYEKLCELVAHTTKCGLIPSVVTNGFWAENESITNSRVAELKKLGLKRVNISYDYHHSKFVPVENINRLIKCCEKEGLVYAIAATKLREEKIGDLIETLDKDMICMNLVVSNCQPVGRAKENYESGEFSKTIRTRDMKCHYDGIITVYFDGRILPCCSHFVFNSQLSIGHYSSMNMPMVLEKIKNNSLLYILRNYGLDPFLAMNKKVSEELEEYVSCPCDVCERLFSSEMSQYTSGAVSFLREKGIINE